MGIDMGVDVDIDMAVSITWRSFKGSYGVPLKGCGVDIMRVFS